jgi:hypothetical protein
MMNGMGPGRSGKPRNPGQIWRSDRTYQAMSGITPLSPAPARNPVDTLLQLNP